MGSPSFLLLSEKSMSDSDFQAALVAALQPLANSQNVVLTVSYTPAAPAPETVTVSPVA